MVLCCGNPPNLGSYFRPPQPCKLAYSRLDGFFQDACTSNSMNEGEARSTPHAGRASCRELFLVSAAAAAAAWPSSATLWATQTCRTDTEGSRDRYRHSAAQNGGKKVPFHCRDPASHSLILTLFSSYFILGSPFLLPQRSNNGESGVQPTPELDETHGF